MTNSCLAFDIGLMAGAIFFIDGWGPTEKKDERGEGGLINSRRFRGLSIIISGGIISPVLDYIVTKNARHDFFLGYLQGSVVGWFSVFMFGLILYVLWKFMMDKRTKLTNIQKDIWYNLGEVTFSILDFIYLGIADNPHLKKKRDRDLELYGKEVVRENKEADIYSVHSARVLKETLKKEWKNDLPPEITGDMKEKLNEFDRNIEGTKTKAEYTFDDWYVIGVTAYTKKEYTKTIASMEKALEIDPHHKDAHDATVFMSFAYGRMGKEREAREKFNEAFRPPIEGDIP